MDKDHIQQIITAMFLSDVDFADPGKVSPQERFFVIPGKSGPRWIVPKNSLLGMPVLKQWRTYDVSSRIKWLLILAAYRVGRLGMLPGVVEVGLAGISNIDWKHKGWRAESSLLPVIYIGTPGPQQKVVATLINSDSFEPLAVMKVALGIEAHVSIIRESKALKMLSIAGVKEVPVLLALEETNGHTWQSIVTGRLTSRKLTEFHVDWLLQLPNTEKITTLDKQRKILDEFIKNEIHPGPVAGYWSFYRHTG